MTQNIFCFIVEYSDFIKYTVLDKKHVSEKNEPFLLLP